jgi:hypothetical protein
MVTLGVSKVFGIFYLLTSLTVGLQSVGATFVLVKFYVTSVTYAALFHAT